MSTNHVIGQDHTPSPYRYEPQDMASALRFADAVVRSGLTPNVRSKEQAFVLLATGAELGLTAMQSLRSIHVIDGKPCLSADLIVGLVKRSPVCEWFRLVESTNEQAVYETQRRGEPKPTRYGYTVADARRANLLNKRSWRQHPAAMLRARAASALARAVYPDLVAGVYDPEELEHVDRHSGSRRPHPTLSRQPQPKPAARKLEEVDRSEVPGAALPKPEAQAQPEEEEETVETVEAKAVVEAPESADVPEVEEAEVEDVAAAEPEVTEEPEVEEEEHEEDEAVLEVAEEEDEDEEPRVDPLITLPGIGKALSARLKDAGVFSLEQFAEFAEGEAWREISGFHDSTRQRALTAARQRIEELQAESAQAEAESTEEAPEPRDALTLKRDAIADMGLRDAAKHIAKALVRTGLFRKGDSAMQALAAQVQELGVQPTEASLEHLAQAWLNVEASHRF